MALALISIHPAVADENARSYLESLKAGEKLDIRPDCGRWTQIVDIVEDAYERAQRKTEIVAALLQAMIHSGKYPGLVDLIAPPASSSSPALPTDDLLAFPALPAEVQLSPDLAYGACQWLDDYIEYSREVSPEGYEGFHEACGIWTLATVAGRRIKIPFSRKQYTPLMIALVARTSLYAKSNTAEAAISVLRAAGLRWLLGSDETTPQKLLSDMAGVLPRNYGDLDEERQFYVRQRLAMSGQRGWYYDEFGNLVKAMSKAGGVMQDFKGLLLKLDNCADSYEYSTQSRGAELIEKPYLSLLGSMTPSDIKSNAKSGSDFWKDGFWARFAFICPPPNTAKDEPFSLGETPVPDALRKPLFDWHTRLGEPSVTVEEKKDEKNKVTGYSVFSTPLPETTVIFGPGVYEAWVHYRSALKTIIKDWHTQDLDGSYQRLPIKAIRIAALFASLENNGLIEMKHWAKAQEIAERWRESLHELYRQVNIAEFNEPTFTKRIEDDVIRCVRKLEDEKQPPTVRDLSRYLTKIDLDTIKTTLNSLVRAGVLAEEKTGRSSRYSYVKEE